MKDLIKIENITIGDTCVPTVNARELHEFLESKQDYSTWIKKRIDDYDFLENKDYIVFHKKMENPLGGRPVKEYHITIEMAKELAMVERNEKGRAYFIECEKKLQTHALPQTKIEAVRAYLEELEAHEATRVVLADKLENGKSIYGASIRQVALKTGRNYSAKKLTRWCKANCRPPLVVRQDNPNGYSSAKVSVYHAEAWREVYDIELLEYFEEDELRYTPSGNPYEHH